MNGHGKDPIKCSIIRTLTIRNIVNTFASTTPGEILITGEPTTTLSMVELLLLTLLLVYVTINTKKLINISSMYQYPIYLPSYQHIKMHIQLPSLQLNNMALADLHSFPFQDWYFH